MYVCVYPPYREICDYFHYFVFYLPLLGGAESIPIRCGNGFLNELETGDRIHVGPVLSRGADSTSARILIACRHSDLFIPDIRKSNDWRVTKLEMGGIPSDLAMVAIPPSELSLLGNLIVFARGWLEAYHFEQLSMATYRLVDRYYFEPLPCPCVENFGN